MSVQNEITQLYQAWKQSDYDALQGRPDFLELVMRELSITKEEALNLFQEMNTYPQ